MSAHRNYTKYIDFGKDVNNQVKSPFNASNPLTYCMFSTLGTQFMHGSSTSNYYMETIIQLVKVTWRNIVRKTGMVFVMHIQKLTLTPTGQMLVPSMVFPTILHRLF